MATESCSEYIDRCATDCNCNGTLFSDNDGKTLVKKLALKIDADKEVPFFDLGEMGLDAITPGGDAVAINTDTSGLMAALANGAVKLRIRFNFYGSTLTGVAQALPLYLEESSEYQVVAMGVISGTPMYASFSVDSAIIVARCSVLATA